MHSIDVKEERIIGYKPVDINGFRFMQLFMIDESRARRGDNFPESYHRNYRNDFWQRGQYRTVFCIYCRDELIILCGCVQCGETHFSKCEIP